MAKLTPELKERILAEYKGGISQNKLAKTYKLSPATINKICKGVEQCNKDAVNILATKKLLDTSDKSDIEIDAINDIAEEKSKYLLFFQNSALKNQQKANEILKKATNLYELEMHAKTTCKNKEIVLGRDAQTQINNSLQGVSISAQISEILQDFGVDDEHE